VQTYLEKIQSTKATGTPSSFELVDGATGNDLVLLGSVEASKDDTWDAVQASLAAVGLRTYAKRTSFDDCVRSPTWRTWSRDVLGELIHFPTREPTKEYAEEEESGVAIVVQLVPSPLEAVAPLGENESTAEETLLTWCEAVRAKLHETKTFVIVAEESADMAAAQSNSSIAANDANDGHVQRRRHISQPLRIETDSSDDVEDHGDPFRDDGCGWNHAPARHPVDPLSTFHGSSRECWSSSDESKIPAGRLSASSTGSESARSLSGSNAHHFKGDSECAREIPAQTPPYPGNKAAAELDCTTLEACTGPAGRPPSRAGPAGMSPSMDGLVSRTYTTGIVIGAGAGDVAADSILTGERACDVATGDVTNGDIIPGDVAADSILTGERACDVATGNIITGDIIPGDVAVVEVATGDVTTHEAEPERLLGLAEVVDSQPCAVQSTDTVDVGGMGGSASKRPSRSQHRSSDTAGQPLNLQDGPEHSREVVPVPLVLWLPVFFSDEYDRCQAHCIYGEGECLAFRDTLEWVTPSCANVRLDLFSAEFEALKAKRSRGGRQLTHANQMCAAVALVLTMAQDVQWMWDNEFPDLVAKLLRDIATLFRTKLLRCEDEELGLGESCKPQDMTASREALNLLLTWCQARFKQLSWKGEPLKFGFLPGKPKSEAWKAAQRASHAARKKRKATTDRVYGLVSQGKRSKSATSRSG
jgi:hypothetical protein